MIQSKGARRMIALLVVAAAVFTQDAVISGARANHETAATAVLSADRLTVGSLSFSEAAPEASLPYGVRLEAGGLAAPETPLLANKIVRTRLTLLDLAEAEPGRRDASLRWPVNRDSAGAPIVLTWDFTAPLIKVRF